MKRIFKFVFVLVFGFIFISSKPVISSKKIAKEIYEYKINEIKIDESIFKKIIYSLSIRWNSDETIEELVNFTNERIETESDGIKSEIYSVVKDYKGNNVVINDLLKDKMYTIKEKPGLLSGIKNGSFIVFRPLWFLVSRGNAYLSKYDFYPEKLKKSLQDISSEEKLKEIYEYNLFDMLFEFLKFIWTNFKLMLSLFFMNGNIFYHISYLISLILSLFIILIPLIPSKKTEIASENTDPK